jgi:hypothetical protein
MLAARNEQGLLGKTTAQEVVNRVKADYCYCKRRLDTHLSAANVTHTNLAQAFLEVQCTWEKFVHVQVTADSLQLVKAAMRRTYLASYLDNNPCISKYVESGKRYVNADALVSKLLDKRNL